MTAAPPDTVVAAVRRHALEGSTRTVGTIDLDDPSPHALSYPRFWNRAVGCAERLVAAGVRRGDRIALDMATSLDTMIATVGVWAAGAVLVPLPEGGRLRPGGQSFQRAATVLSAARADWCLAPVATAAGYREAARAAGVADRLRVRALLELAAGPPASSTEPPVWPEPADTALIQFSSGSLAEPKGIVLTHHNVTVSLAAPAERTGLDARSRGLAWVPLSHDMGLLACFGICLYNGAALAMLPPRSFVLDPLGWLEHLSSFAATHTAGPPVAYRWATLLAPLAADRLAGCDLSALRVAMIGGEHIPPELCARFEAALAPWGLRRHVVLPAYGLAENGAGVTLREPLVPRAVRDFDRGALAEGRLAPPGPDADSSTRISLLGNGRPIRGTRLRVTDPAGRELPPGGVGEVQVAGESATCWLLDRDGTPRPAGDAAGFVPTGDLGALLDGELYVVGRSKELFKRGGRAFAPADLEAAILAAGPPGVAEAAAVAVRPVDADEESLLVFLELFAPDAGRVVLDAAVSAVRLALFRGFGLRPGELYVGGLRSLPRTTSGKLRRTALAAAYRAGRLIQTYPVRPVPVVAGSEGRAG